MSKNYITDTLKKRQGVIFCGSGISLDPPALAPRWDILRDYSIQAITSIANELLTYIDILTKTRIFPGDSQKGLIPEVVFSKIYDSCNTFFRSFKSLEAGSPNNNHIYLAKLAKSGYLKYIVTTNFDTFIESALSINNIKYNVYRDEKEFKNFVAHPESNTVHLLKIHGCISSPDSIITKIEQEARGLSLNKRHALNYLLSKYILILWGYSGADLKINLDYLCLESNKDKGVIWNLYNDKETPNKYVKKLLDIHGDKSLVTYGLLPASFDSIVNIDTKKYTDAERKKLTEEKNRNLLDSLTKWAKKNISKDLAYNIIGELLYEIGRFDDALACFNKMIELTNSSKLKAKALNSMGSIHHKKGEEEKSLGYYDQALKIGKTCDPLITITALNNIGSVFASQHKNDEALKHYDEALNLTNNLTNETKYKNLAYIYGNIGHIHEKKGQFSQAIKYYKDAIEIDEITGDIWSKSSHLNNLNNVYQKVKKYYEPELIKESIEINRMLGDRKNLAISISNLSSYFFEKNDIDEALSLFEESLKYNKETNNNLGIVGNYSNIGLCYNSKEEFDHALDCFNKGLNLCLEEDKYLEIKAVILNNIGDLHDKNGDFDNAIKYYNDSLKIFKKLEYLEPMAIISSTIGKSFIHLGNTINALEYLETSLTYYTKLNMAKQIDYVKSIIATLKNDHKLKKEAFNLITNYYKKHPSPEGKYIIDTLVDQILKQLYSKKNKHKKVLQFLKKVAKSFKELKLSKEEGASHAKIASIYFQIKQYTEAIPSLEQSITIYEGIQDIEPKIIKTLKDQLSYAKKLLNLYKR